MPHLKAISITMLSGLVAACVPGSDDCPVPGLFDLKYVASECQFYLGTRAFRAGKYEVAAAHWKVVVSAPATSADDKNFANLALGTLTYLKYNGLGVEQDRRQAVADWIEAAKRNNFEARRHLGFAYSDPEFEDRDMIRALAWYKSLLLTPPNPDVLGGADQDIYDAARLGAEAIEQELSQEEIEVANELAFELLNLQ